MFRVDACSIRLSCSSIPWNRNTKIAYFIHSGAVKLSQWQKYFLLQFLYQVQIIWKIWFFQMVFFSNYKLFHQVVWNVLSKKMQNRVEITAVIYFKMTPTPLFNLYTGCHMQLRFLRCICVNMVGSGWRRGLCQNRWKMVRIAIWII